MTTPFEADAIRIRRLVDRRLDALVPGPDVSPRRLHEAVRYSLFAGGKRVRPILALLAARAGGDENAALDPACAVELVHTASLILDDLPSMDDARTRRGRETNHLVFGESTAILAGIALMNRGFGVLADCSALDDASKIAAVRLLSDAIGSDGCVGGQFHDLAGAAAGLHRGPDGAVVPGTGGLERLHNFKTGALFVAAGVIGGRVGGLTGARLDAVRDFAQSLGLAFQVLDDVLDASATAHAAGKDVGQDSEKKSFVSVLGLEEAKAEGLRHLNRAIGSLAPLGHAGDPLKRMADMILASSDGLTADAPTSLSSEPQRPAASVAGE